MSWVLNSRIFLIIHVAQKRSHNFSPLLSQDELLVGVLKQVSFPFNYFSFANDHLKSPSHAAPRKIRLKETREKKQSSSKMKNSRTHSSLHMAKEILQKICFSQLDITKSKSCENLHVL